MKFWLRTAAAGSASNRAFIFKSVMLKRSRRSLLVHGIGMTFFQVTDHYGTIVLQLSSYAPA